MASTKANLTKVSDAKPRVLVSSEKPPRLPEGSKIAGLPDFAIREAQLCAISGNIVLGYLSLKGRRRDAFASIPTISDGDIMPIVIESIRFIDPVIMG